MKHGTEVPGWHLKHGADRALMTHEQLAERIIQDGRLASRSDLTLLDLATWIAGAARTVNPCLECNAKHMGVMESVSGHRHNNAAGVGNVRLVLVGNGKIEYCWRCRCRKSGWRNVANRIDADHCADIYCVCHRSDREAE